MEINNLLKLCDDSRLDGAIQELGDLRKTQVESAKKFLSNLPWQQMIHIESENTEEKEAFHNWLADRGTRIELGMELLDGQYTRQTMLEILFNKEDIIELHRLVKEKNAARNYHIKQNDSKFDPFDRCEY